jgi:hypothetical protein
MASKNRNAFCSFCRKSYHDVGPLVEGPGEVYICGECIELCQSIIEQEKRRRGTDPTVQQHEIDQRVESCRKYFMDYLGALAQKGLNDEEITLLQQIAGKTGEITNLLAARAEKKESS